MLANASDVDGPSLTATNLAISSGSGTLVDNGNGTWTYTPALNDDAAVSFSYTVTDGSLSAAGSATLDITPVNDAPVTTPVTLTAIAEDSGARVITQAELLANASDVDGPSLTATGLAIASGSGTLVNNGDGSWTYTPASNDDSSASFSYTVTDGSLGVAASATLDITPVNDAPATTPSPRDDRRGQRCPRHHPGPVAGQCQRRRRAEPDRDQPGDQRGSGTLVNNGNGTWTYTPALNDDAAVSFSYTVTDGSLTAAGSATLDITPVNDAPLLTPISNQAVDEGATLAFTVSATDADLPSQSLTYSLDAASLALGMTIDANSGSFSWTPGESQGGLTPSVTVTVTDNGTGNLSASQTFTITVAELNEAPTTNPLTLTAVAEDSSPRVITQAELLASASDVDGSSLTATGLAISAGNGTLVDNGDGSWTYTPALNDDTAVSFSYTVTDGSLTALGSATLDIAALNDAPVITAASLRLEPGQALLLSTADLRADDVDSSTSALIFNVRNVTAGHFELAANPGVPVDQFTQAQVAQGQVLFVYTSATQIPRFDVTVFDGSARSAEISVAASVDSTGPWSTPPSKTAQATQLAPTLPEIEHGHQHG